MSQSVLLQKCSIRGVIPSTVFQQPSLKVLLSVPVIDLATLWLTYICMAVGQCSLGNYIR